MTPRDEAAARSLASFGAAAEDYDSEAQSFFPRFGQLTVERLALVPGARVLDVACGTGNSVLPAANAVGASGSVLGVDLTQQMLDIARTRVDAAGFTNVELVCADMRDLDLAPQSFDAVVSVFGIFFVPDMAGLLADLWELVAPGGQLAVTTWGPDLFEPLWSTYWNAVQTERPELRPSGGRYDEISTPAGMQVLVAEAGIDAGVDAVVEIEAFDAMHPMRDGDDWWGIVRGSGLRGAADALDDDHRARVRAACDAAIAGPNGDDGVDEVPVNVVFTRIVRPA
ncbi:MAG: methyltransferase domain-containing protein [Acidimicrobiia bacterium]